MTRAEKFIREYNNFNGKKISRKKLHDFHSRLKKEIDAKRIDAHVQYGPELLAIEKRLAKVLPKAAPKVTVICDKPVRVKRRAPQNVIITQTAQGQEVIKARNKAVHYHHEDVTFFYGLPCNPPEAYPAPGLGFTKEGQQKIYDMINGMILKLMKDEKKLPWQKPWTIRTIPATNFKSKTEYKGANMIMLNMIAPMFFGKTGPYWLTYKQAQELGGQVKKGAEAFPVIYYSVYYVINKPTRKTITEDQYKAMSDAEKKDSGATELFTINYYNVFPQEDITGIDFPVHGDRRNDASPIESAQAIIDGMPNRPEIIHHNAGRAFYSPVDDHIKLPPIEYFKQDQNYYSTLFHELVHATGHKSRLDRFEKNKKEAEDKDDYAYEELIAELGASYLNAEAGTLYFTMKNSATYLKGWQSKLEDIMKDDNKFFLRAAAQAAKAADYIMNVSVDKDKAITKKDDDKSRTPVKREEPAAKKPKHMSLNGIVDASQLGSLQFSKIELDGKYKDDFLKVNGDTQMMIWGSPGSGKTVYTLEFAQYLAEKQNLQVLYVANEEWGRSTFAEKIDRFKIGHANLKFVESLASLKDAGATVDDFDVIFFDSVNSMGMTLDDYRKFAKENRGIIKVLIVQSTKDGDFRGGKDWEHEVDIAGEVKNRKIILRKNRLDEDFTKKSDKLLIEEQVKEGQRKKMIREKVQAKATEPKQDTV